VRRRGTAAWLVVALCVMWLLAAAWEWVHVQMEGTCIERGTSSCGIGYGWLAVIGGSIVALGITLVLLTGADRS
jgi:hypothetical protein